MELLINDKKRAWEDLGAGVSRKVMSYNADLMVVKVRFEVGSVGAEHQHPHTQISYVESGTFEYTIADESFTIEAGDTCLIPPNTLHGCRCINAGILVDAFSPVREDFL